MLGAQRRESAIDLLAHERRIAQQANDLVPDERVQPVLPDRTVRAPTALGIAPPVRSQAAVVVDDPPRLLLPRRRPIVGIAARATDQQSLQQARHLRVAGGEPAILSEPSLGQRELGRGDERRHGNLDPLGTGTIPQRRGMNRNTPASSQTSIHPNVLARRHRGFLETRRSLIGRVAQHAPDRGAVPVALARAGRDAAVREPAREGGNGHRVLGVASEHFPHHRRLRLEDLVAGRGFVGLADVAIAVGSARQHVHDAAARAVPLAPAGPLADLRFLVLGNHALELHQEDILGRLDPRGMDEHHLDARPGELLEQQHLVRVLAAEPIGAVHKHGIDLSLGRQVAHALQPRPNEGRSTPAFILKDPALRHQIVVLGGVRAEGARLTGDRLLLFLPVRRDPSVDRGGLHGRSLLSPESHPATARAARGAVGPTPRADTPGSAAHSPGGQTRSRARRGYPPPPGPGRPRCSQSSSPRVTRALRRSPVARAMVRSRRARLTGSLTVNTAVASGTGTPSRCCWAASTYRRAWRSDTRYRRARVCSTAAGGNRRSRSSARLTRSAYWAIRARRRCGMCHEGTMLYVIHGNLFDTEAIHKE